MVLGLFGRKRIDPGIRDNGSVLLLTDDRNLVRTLDSVCLTLGVECLEGNSRKAAVGNGNATLLYVVIDARGTVDNDLISSSWLHNAPVIVLGPNCPPAPTGRQSVAVACNGNAEAAARTVGRLLEDAVARRRLSRLQCELDLAVSRAGEDARAMASFREQLAIYERQRDQLAEVVRRTAYLGQLSKEINCLDVDRIVDICVNKVSKLVEATTASIYFVSEDGTELVLRRCNHSRRISDRLPAGSDPARLMSIALEKKAVLLIKDVDVLAKSLRRPIDRTYKSNYATGSCIVVPLVSDDRVVAVLNLADKADGSPFDEVRDLPLVDHVSQFLGIALRNCQLYQQVWQLAKTDALTGFINHKAFFDELSREVARSKRTNGSLSLILLDVDNFKLFNDVHGHQVGDLVLRQVAHLIKGNIRTVDTAARYGGDEFAVILADTDVAQAEVVAERIRRAIAGSQLELRGQTFCVTISAGVARFAPDRTLADLVSDTDAALYRAKSKGRNAVAACGAS